MWMKSINSHLSWIECSLKCSRNKARRAAAAAERDRNSHGAAPMRVLRASERFPARARRRRAA